MLLLTAMETLPFTTRGWARLAPAVLGSCWLVLCAGIWIQSFTGASYDFSIYSQRIKDSLGFDQQQLDSVSFAKDIGANVGVLSGLLYDASSPWVSLSAAAVLGFTGNLMMWLSITSRVAAPSLWLVCFYALITANAQTFTNTTAVVTCVKIFPTSRGVVIGLMKGCVGLSGAILVQLYYAVYGDQSEDFPLLMTWLFPCMCILVMPIMRLLSVGYSRDQNKRLNDFSVVLVLLAAYLTVTIVLQNCLSFGRAWKIAVFVGIACLLVLPVGVVVRAELTQGTHEEEDSISCGLLQSSEAMKSNRTANLGEESEVQHASGRLPSDSFVDRPTKQRQRGENANLWQAVQSLDFWFLFFASACGMGSGLTTINNMSQLGSSLNYDVNEINTFVSLWSIWNFMGRFGGGYVSERFFQSKGTARPLFISGTLAAMVLGHIIIAVGFTGALYVGPILVGICYGAQWSLMPSTASELFGLQSFGAVFNTIAMASPLGSYILSVWITGYFYDQEAVDDSCSGAHCFRLSFLVMAGVCAAGSCSSAAFFVRTRRFYRERWKRADR